MVNRKKLNPDSSPRAAFGARLRSSREARGWKQDDLGTQMGYSGRHISAIETARKPPSLPFSRAADTALGTEGTFELLWREMAHGALLEGFSAYVDLEARATEIRVYETGVVPGLLQTPAYARALAEGHVRRGVITPEQATERVAVLMERQKHLLRPRPPTMLVVLDESCIRRPVGGEDVMAEQLQHLVALAELPNTVVQIAPFAMAERRPFDLPIYLITMADRSMAAYAESQFQGHLDRELSFALGVLSAYHQLQAGSLSQTSSVDVINQVRKGIS
ncbi:helix-turn-helix transcriptional regulator [Streptomyces sp. NPDC047315]|uniref:helix-turn-helix domain-containing protein n=1 Tax=Streptomyces sp. NPDC047315 TaxID=3155142 RepID=UPI0033F8981D